MEKSVNINSDINSDNERAEQFCVFVRLLGFFQLLIHGQPVPQRGRKTEQLLNSFFVLLLKFLKTLFLQVILPVTFLPQDRLT